MEKNNKKSVNYIGMFDLLKGVGMLLIILGHTVNNYTFAGTQMHVGMMAFGVVYILVGAGVLQAFFLISGYGFRRTSIRSCIKKQTILMLKPYMYITIGTAALHIFLIPHGWWRHLPNCGTLPPKRPRPECWTAAWRSFLKT